MYYGITKLATDFEEKDRNDWKVKLIRFIFFFIPMANPDNDKKLHLVEKWVLEVDDTGQPLREIALGESDEPLFSAPNDRNFGFWTDNTFLFKKDELEEIDKNYFETRWKQLNRK